MLSRKSQIGLCVVSAKGLPLNEEHMRKAKGHLRFARSRVESACLLFVLWASSADAQVDQAQHSCTDQPPALSGLTYNENDAQLARSEERRVGKECRSRWSP